MYIYIYVYTHTYIYICLIYINPALCYVGNYLGPIRINGFGLVHVPGFRSGAPLTRTRHTQAPNKRALSPKTSRLQALLFLTTKLFSSAAGPGFQDQNPKDVRGKAGESSCRKRPDCLQSHDTGNTGPNQQQFLTSSTNLVLIVA